MKVLVIGQGGREHAIIKALKNSPSVTQIHALPGSDGMKKHAIVHSIKVDQYEQIVQLCIRLDIDFVFIGPENPLVAGLSDRLRERGLFVVGPDSQAAQLEGSKLFAKEFMLEAGVPTAPYHEVKSTEETLKVAELFSPPYILKADGLAAGKGVFICRDKSELTHAATLLFDKKELGSAGDKVLLEQNLPGWELSVLVLTNGDSYQILPLAQDHKRLQDGDLGPNTGGMGTIAPVPIEKNLMKQIENDIVKPSINLIKKRSYVYRGVLFIGIMVTAKGPYVLEYNVRLGDPETQVVLPLIQNDVGLLFKDLSQGKLSEIKYKNIHSCCVILAAEGYPEKPVTGTLIEGTIDYESDSSYLLHAGSKQHEGKWITNGGRVLCSVGIGSTQKEATQNSYMLVEKVSWNGVQFRKDIGAKLPAPAHS